MVRILQVLSFTSPADIVTSESNSKVSSFSLREVCECLMSPLSLRFIFFSMKRASGSNVLRDKTDMKVYPFRKEQPCEGSTESLAHQALLALLINSVSGGEQYCSVRRLVAMGTKADTFHETPSPHLG